MTRHSHIAFMGLSILTMVGIVYLLWAIFIDGIVVRKPITIYDQKEGVQIQTDKFIYNQGEMVYGLIKYCKNRNIEVQFQWSLVDSYLKFFPKKRAQAAIGCHEVLTQIEQIPYDQYPDTDLYFETVLIYEINGLNTVYVPLRTNTFKVQ